MANVKKAECHKVLKQTRHTQAFQVGATTTMALVVTKELYKILMDGNFCPGFHQIDDLMLGIHPFTCGYIKGTAQGTAVEVHVQSYDLMLEGQVAPGLTEKETFCMDSVPLPTFIFQAF